MDPNSDSIDQLVQNCESEKLHRIGGIQPPGSLLAGHIGGHVIRAVSENTASVLGRPIDEVLDKTVADLLPDLTIPNTGEKGERVFLPECAEGPNGWLDGVLSFGDTHWLLELEPASEDGGFSTINTSVSALLTTPSTLSQWQDYKQKTVDTFRAVTGYDRIMLYHFREDGSGEVTAESGSGAYGSYLGLRFPASDIPQIARNLYLKNPHRQIADVSVPPIPIVALDSGDEPDLTYSDLRAVSPVHLQYLKNMEVGASLSFSIIGGGELWGLVACHNRTPKFLDYTVRSRCAELANAFAMGMMAYGSNKRLSYVSAVDRDIGNAIELLQKFEEEDGNREELGEAILGLVDATGAALIDDFGIYRFGACPTSSFIEDLDRWMLNEVREEIWSTDCLAEHIHSSADHAATAAGVLAVHSSGTLRLEHGNLRFYWFRGEVPQTIKWAGDPRKAVTKSGKSLQLSPRNSFDLYLEETRYRSTAWSEVDLMTAKKYRSLLLRRFSRMFGPQ